MIIRKTFPQVYALESPDKGKYWLVSARSAKWGLNQRKIFSAEELALKYARDLDAQVVQNRKQSDIPKEKVQAALSYEKLIAKLSGYGRTPEEAVNHFLVHLGNEAAKQAKPFIRDLVDSWKQFKYADSTFSHRTVVEIRSYARFIKTKWGGLKPDGLKRNDIDLLLKKLKIANNTRRKYLLYVRMFFSWMKAEGHISQNPTDGIKYKVGGFNGAFYTPEDTKKLLRHVAEREPDLIGYYALLTFAGLRPSEGDHQVTHIYVNDHTVLSEVRATLERTPGVGEVWGPEDKRARLGPPARRRPDGGGGTRGMVHLLLLA